MRVFCVWVMFSLRMILGVGMEDVFAANILRNFISIEELNQKEIERGSYHIEGFVVYSYSCPECLEDVFCKLCMADNIIVSKNDFPRRYEDLTDHEIIVFVEDSSVFEVGEKYRILLQVLDVKTIDQPVNNVKLIYSEKLK